MSQLNVVLNKLLQLSALIILIIGGYLAYVNFISPPVILGYADKIISKYGSENIYRTDAYFITDKPEVIKDYLRENNFTVIEQRTLGYSIISEGGEYEPLIIQKEDSKPFLYSSLKDGVRLKIPRKTMWIKDAKGKLRYLRIPKEQDVMLDFDGDKKSFNELIINTIFDSNMDLETMRQIGAKINAIQH